MTIQLESDLLRSFVAVADLENFTRAADLLYFIGVDRIQRIDRTHDVGSIDPDPV